MNFHPLSRPQRDSVIPLTLFRSWLTGIASWVAFLILGMTSHGAWTAHCPFCPPSQPTYAEHLANSDVAILVQWKGQKVHSEQEATTTFEIVDLLKGDPKDWKKGEKSPSLMPEMDSQATSSSSWGRPMPVRKKKNTNWVLVQEVNEVLYGYIRKAPHLRRRIPGVWSFIGRGLNLSIRKSATMLLPNSVGPPTPMSPPSKPSINPRNYGSGCDPNRFSLFGKVFMP